MGVGTVGSEALDMEDIGAEGGDRAPQREQRAGTGDRRAADGRPVGGRQGHGQAADHDPVEDLHRLRGGVVRMAGPDFDLVTGVAQREGQMPRQLLDTSE